MYPGSYGNYYNQQQTQQQNYQQTQQYQQPCYQYQNMQQTQTQGMIPGFSSNPMYGAIPHANGSQEGTSKTPSSGKFIPPAKAPTREYIPPPPKPLEFTYRASNSGIYAKIYSLLTTVDILNDEYANGNVNDNFYDKKLSQYKEIFNRSVQSAGFNREDIEKFAESCRLTCPLAFDCLFSEKAKKINFEDAKNLGANYATLMSFLEVGPFTISNVQRYFNSFRLLCERVCPEKDNDIRKNIDGKTQHWNTYFNNRKSDQEMPGDDVGKLKTDVQNMYAWLSS